MTNYTKGMAKTTLIQLLKEGVMQTHTLWDAYSMAPNSPQYTKEKKNYHEVQKFVSKMVEQLNLPLKTRDLSVYETKEGIEKVAEILYEGVAWRESLLEAYGHFPDSDPTKQQLTKEWKSAKRFFKKFKINYGFSVEPGKLERLLKNAESVDIHDLSRVKGNSFDQKIKNLRRSGKINKP